MKYLAETPYVHDAGERVGILLVNHGSPDGTDTRSIRRYLRRFLSDPRLIELPRWLWLSILNGVVLTTRPRRTARLYRKIWTPEGSPMVTISAALRQRLAGALQEEFGERVQLATGMTYGRPAIADALAELRAARCSRLLVIPLYPQYSATTVGAVFDAVTRELQRWRWVPELRFVSDYSDLPAYADALAESLRTHWREHGRCDRLLFSFHGIPSRYAQRGDPYPCLCHKTVRLVVERLGLAPDEYACSFQSNFGPGEWLRPYTRDVLTQWRDAGQGRVDVICPGFSVDCLETLEEIGVGLAGEYARGGGELRLVPCLNAGSGQLAALRALVGQQMAGWENALRPVQAVPPLASSGRARQPM